MVMNHLLPIKKVKDYVNCVTPNAPNVNIFSFDSIKSDDKIVTPNKTSSEYFLSIISYKSPVDGLQCKIDVPI